MYLLQEQKILYFPMILGYFYRGSIVATESEHQHQTSYISYMKLLRTLLTVLTVGFISLTATAQSDASSACNMMKKGGWFKMGDISDTSNYMVISSSSQTEYYNYKRYWVRSSIRWISECEYELTVLSINYPGLLCKRGDKMTVKVLNADNNSISYEAMVDGKRERGRYLKMDIK